MKLDDILNLISSTLEELTSCSLFCKKKKDLKKLLRERLNLSKIVPELLKLRIELSFLSEFSLSKVELSKATTENFLFLNPNGRNVKRC
jgi:hypothetical protein